MNKWFLIEENTLQRCFLKGKPIRLDYKAWTLAPSDGLVLNIHMYSGKSTDPKSSEQKKFTLGGVIVLNFLSVVGNLAKLATYYENFFTSFYLKYLLIY